MGFCWYLKYTSSIQYQTHKKNIENENGFLMITRQIVRLVFTDVDLTDDTDGPLIAVDLES